MRYTVLCMFGPPSCGKGEVDLGLERVGFPHIRLPMSKALAELAEIDIANSEIIKTCMQNGDYVPDNVTIPAFKRAWEYVNKEGHIVYDGVVRTLAQAAAVAELVSDHSFVHNFVIVVIDVPLDVCRMRAKGRNRADDIHQEKRLSLYAEKTVPAIEELAHLTQKEVLRVTNERHPDETAREIIGLINRQTNCRRSRR